MEGYFCIYKIEGVQSIYPGNFAKHFRSNFCLCAVLCCPSQVNYKYVKVLAKKRSQIIQEILEATLNYFPSNIEENQFSIDVSQSIETFFLTDHCIELDGVQSDEHKNYSISVSKELETEKNSIDSTPEKKSPKSAGDKKLIQLHR